MGDMILRKRAFVHMVEENKGVRRGAKLCLGRIGAGLEGAENGARRVT